MVKNKSIRYLDIESATAGPHGISIKIPEHLSEKYYGCAEYGHIVLQENKIIDMRQAHTEFEHNQNAAELEAMYENSSIIMPCQWSSYTAFIFTNLNEEVVEYHLEEEEADQFKKEFGVNQSKRELEEDEDLEEFRQSFYK